MALSPYGPAEAEIAIRRALEGEKVFEISTPLSSPAAVRDAIERTAHARGVEVVLRLAPKGVLIAHAERSQD